MKHSVFTVVLPELTIEEQAEAIAGCGYAGVEWRVAPRPMEYKPSEPFNFWQNRVEEIWIGNVVEEAPRLRRLAEANGLETVSLASYSPPSEFEALKAVCQACEITGANFFRIGFILYDGKTDYNVLYERAVKDLEKVAQMAQQRGVRACLELHGETIHPSAGLARRLLQHFDAACVGAIYDAGNLPGEGYEETKLALELLGDYLGYVHVKDGRWVQVDKGDHEPDPRWMERAANYLGPARGWQWESAQPGQGQANWPKVMALLKQRGFDGWFSNEDFRTSPPTLEKISQDLEYLKVLEKGPASV